MKVEYVKLDTMAQRTGRPYMRFLRQHSRLRLALILALVASAVYLMIFIYTRKPVVHWRNTRHCVRELLYTHEEFEIKATSREDLVRALLDTYDVKWDALPAQTPAQLTSSWYSCRHVHRDNQPHLGAVLKWLSTAEIVKVKAGVGGNLTGSVHTGHGAKFEFHFQDGSKALFKPKMYEREQIEPGFIKGNMGPDRHNGEIASYHLQRLLGFNRAPLVVGRRVDVVQEILPVADSPITRDWNIVDHQLCMQMKILAGMQVQRVKVSNICAENGFLEGALIMWLPRPLSTAWFKNPGLYEENKDFLDPKSNKLVYPLAEDKTKLLDYIDALLLDYLVQNPDRHLVDFFNASYSAILLVDNGKSFGDPETDHNNVIEVFQYRCQMRSSTYTRLKQLRDGVLSEVLRHILSRDPIAPVLWDRHYEALDRRLIRLLTVIDDCITKYGSSHVLLEDVWPSADWSTRLKYLV